MKPKMLLFGLISCFRAFSQDIPELPMKNDYVYYEFEHKLDNSKKCLSYYPSNQNNTSNFTFNTTLQQKTFSLSSDLCAESNDINDLALISLIFQDRALTATNCSDTTTAILMLKLPNRINQSIIWGFYKAGSVTANVQLVYVDKNNYKLIFKAFICTLYEDVGKVKTIDLEEFYSKFQESKKSKYDRLVLNRIENAIKGIDKIIWESFKKAYETDEL
jgi:hypothetical protein